METTPPAVQKAEARSFDRRRLINWFLGTSAGVLVASVLYPVARFITPPRIPEANLSEIEGGTVADVEFREKGFKIVRFGAEPVIVVKAGEDRFVAYAATCTHLDCIVGYQKDRSQLICNCHGGVYDLDGRNVAGPPPRPLTPFKVNLVASASGPATIIVTKA